MDRHSLIDGLLDLDPAEWAALVETLSPAEIEWLLTNLPAVDTDAGSAREPYPWQVPPPGDWWLWALMGGRGIGKTEGGAEWLDDEMEANPGYRCAIIAPTLGDARETCVEGETGLLAVNPRIVFNRSNYTLRWPNGSTGRCFGAYTPEDRKRLRGPQYHRAWLEEFAAWRQIDEEPREDEPDAYQHVTIGLRLGSNPRGIITTTPKRRKRLVEVLARDDVVRTHGTTEQAHGLSPAYRARLLEMYAGTRLAAQELDGILLEDVVGALWTEALLQRHRVPAAPDLARVVVGVDPPATTKGECGIVVAGRSKQRWPHPKSGRPTRHAYATADYSIAGSPEEWGAEAVRAFREEDADAIVAEVNNGGDMVESVIRAVDSTVNVVQVRATRGKAIRAEPIAALSSQGILHMVGRLARLEDQLTSWIPDESAWSPDRLDALVWAVSDLFPSLSAERSQIRSARDRQLPSQLAR